MSEQEQVRKLPVDLEELAYAMEQAWQTEYHLDLETGEIFTFGPDGQGWYLGLVDEGEHRDWESMLVEAAVAMEEDPERFAWVPPLEGHEQYEQMERFTLGLEDEGIRADLLRALDGKGAFSRFRDRLHTYPEVREAWFEHKNAWLDEEVRWWLEGLGIEPVPRPHSEGRKATDGS